MKDANAEYVQKLRINESATDQEIQAALYKLFQSSPQGSISSMNEESGPQGIETRPQIIAATAVSQIQLDNSFKPSLYSYL